MEIIMSVFSRIASIPKLRPQLNVGCLFDIPTGSYHLGINGESILNSGLSLLNSVAGPGNSFKTDIMIYLNLAAAERYAPYRLSIYDTENSLSYERLKSRTTRYPRLSRIDFSEETDDPIISITSSAEMLGDTYFGMIKDIVKDIEDPKSKTELLATPFIDSKQKPISIFRPVGSITDSLSNFEISAVNEKHIDKNHIGDSGNNMQWMKAGGAKKQMLTQMPNLAAKGSMYFSMVAHVGDEFELDPYAPKKHKLTHSKRGSKVTGTTKGFEFLNNILLEIFSASPLNNQQRGTGVLYPDGEIDRGPESTDLLLVTAKITRNKHGPSGISLELIVSQREGLLPHLTQFHYIKNHNWGLDGNVQNYALCLLPDVKLNRTNVRGKINSDAELRRALEFSAELLQIHNLWDTLEDDLMCTPAELYKDLKDLGYDWDILLNTRGYWVFEKDAPDELPYLSTMDLLRMRKKLYRPVWYDKAVEGK